MPWGSCFLYCCCSLPAALCLGGASGSEAKSATIKFYAICVAYMLSYAYGWAIYAIVLWSSLSNTEAGIKCSEWLTTTDEGSKFLTLWKVTAIWKFCLALYVSLLGVQLIANHLGYHCIDFLNPVFWSNYEPLKPPVEQPADPRSEQVQTVAPEVPKMDRIETTSHGLA